MAFWFASWRRLPWQTVAPTLLAPVALIALTGSTRSVEAIRFLRLLAACTGIAAAASFDDAAGSLTWSTPRPHWHRQGAIMVDIALVSTLTWFGALGVAAARGHHLPVRDLTSSMLVCTVLGGAVGIVLVDRRPGETSAWRAVSAFMMLTVVAIIAWPPIAAMDPESTDWIRAHQWLRRALIPSFTVLAIALIIPDARRRPVRIETA